MASRRTSSTKLAPSKILSKSKLNAIEVIKEELPKGVAT